MGVVAAVAAFLTENDANITEAGQFNDQLENAFFMRAAFSPAGPRFPEEAVLRELFDPVACRFDLRWRLTDVSGKTRVLIGSFEFQVGCRMHRRRGVDTGRERTVDVRGHCRGAARAL